MPPGVNPFSEAEKSAAVEVWKAKIPLKRIREQLQMSKRGLRNILAYAKKNPEDPVPKSRKKNAGPNNKVSLGTMRKIRSAIIRDPCTTAKTLKKNIPELANISVRTINRICHDQLKLPTRKMADKPLQTTR